jgi:hypothetical protein
MAMQFKRLSDRILYALQLALEQNDLRLSELLNNALEESLTRKAGGKGFVERREFSAEYEAVTKKLNELRKRI